jgi:hypothetical protein
MDHEKYVKFLWRINKNKIWMMIYF